MTTNRYNPVFRLVVRLIKYFLLMIAGFAIAYLLSHLFGLSALAVSAFPSVTQLIITTGLILMSVLGLLIVVESAK